MKKLIAVTVLFALVPVFAPAKADALTLRQRVTRLEGRLSCLRRVPMTQFTDFAGYGSPTDGQNALNVYATSGDTTVDPDAVDNPDALTDLGTVTGVDWDFLDSAPDYFVLAIRANNNNVPYPGCAAKFGLQPTPSWWRTVNALTRLRQLARVQ